MTTAPLGAFSPGGDYDTYNGPALRHDPVLDGLKASALALLKQCQRGGLDVSEAIACLGPRERVPDRIDRDASGAVDDLVFSRVVMVRLERMTKRHFWGRLYLLDGRMVELGVTGKGVRITAEGPT